MPGVVVLGTSFGCLTHVRTLREAGFDVLAVVGRDAARTAERAKRYDVPLALTSVEEAIALSGVDAVSIATPPASHHALVLQAVQAGKHVLCEKPFASNLAQAEEMLAAAEQAGIVHSLGCEFRFASGQALFAKLIQEGRIGEPIDALFTLEAPLIAPPGSQVPEWWADAAEAGGWLGAYGTHVIDQIRVTLGEVAGVSALLSVRADRLKSADEGFAALMRMESGASVSMRSTARAYGLFLATRIVGSEGTAVLEGDKVTIFGSKGPEVVPMPPELEVLPPNPPPTDGMSSGYDFAHSMGIDFGPYTRLSEIFRAEIEGGDVSKWPKSASFRDGVASQRILDSMRRSARAGGSFELIA